MSMDDLSALDREAMWLRVSLALQQERDAALRRVAALESEIEDARGKAFWDAAQVFARTRDQWIEERGTPDYSMRVEWAYAEAARVLALWSMDPHVIDKALEKIKAELEKELET